MNIVNRGFLFIKPKNAFIDWAQKIAPELLIDQHAEGSVYLIEEDFWDDELIINKYAVQMAAQEFSAITTEEALWPKWQETQEFENYFVVELGCTCFDLLSSSLEREAI